MVKTKVEGFGSSGEHLRNPESYLIRTHERPCDLEALGRMREEELLRGRKQKTDRRTLNEGPNLV